VCDIYKSGACKLVHNFQKKLIVTLFNKTG